MFSGKKSFLFSISLVFFLAMTSWAQVSLLDERGGEIKLKFEVPAYDIGTQVVNGEVCATVRAGSEPPVYEVGYPEVPYFVQSVLIGNDNSVALEVISVKYKEIAVAKVVPSRGQILRSVNPDLVPYSFGSIYSKDSWYPENNASIGEPYIFRDVRGVAVTFNPFQYNGARGILRVVEEMVVAVKTTGVARANVLASDPKVTSEAFGNIYERMFINYSEQRYGNPNDIADGDKMIVIAVDKYKADLGPFVKWKNQKGIKTTIYSYPTESGTGAAGVKAFIQKKFTDEKITYVLLVGSVTDIPGNVTGGPGVGDPPYSIVGSGIYPGVFVGRFDVSSSAELNAIITKSLTYERNPDVNGTWYANAICNGSKDQSSSPYPDWQWMKQFADSLKKGGYEKADVYSEGGAGSCTSGTGATTSAAINAGISWYNYMGHGSQTAQTAPNFTTSNITSLSNNDKYPVAISVACFNGQYDKSCISQTWIRSANKGGIVFLGSYISQAWIPPQYAMQGMMSMIAQDKFGSVGSIVNNGIVRFLDKYKKDESNIFATWNYFGDPSIYLRNKKPTTVTLSNYPAKLTTGTQSFDVSGPDNATVCVYSGTQDIFQSKVIAGGKASFSVNVKNATDTIFVTGSGKNMAPFFGYINNGPTGISLEGSQISEKASIKYNNIMNKVSFSFPNKSATVGISVYALTGKLVYSTNFSAGTKNSVSWNFTNNSGTSLAKGMYRVSMKITQDNGTVSTFNKTLMHF